MIIRFYKIVSLLMKGILHFLSVFSTRASSFLKKRELRIEDLPERKGSKVVWLHGASVGELDQCKALARYIKEVEPNSFIIQSVFSDSVQESNFKDHVSNYNFFLPLDFPNAYNNIFEKLKPDILLIAAWDTWPNLILKAKSCSTKVYLFCATLSKSSGRYKNILARTLTKKVLSLLDGISPTHKIYESIFQELTDSRVKVKVCGDSRFDSVIQKIENKTGDNGVIEKLKSIPKEKVIILGSTYSSCDSLWFPIIKDLLEKGFSFWIFPHKINTERLTEIEKGLKEYNLQPTFFSKLETSSYTGVIVFDLLGVLAYSYQYSCLVYVGGAIHNRVHNVIEPAYFGNPIITGTKIKNASEAVVLNQLGGLFIVNESKDVLSVIEGLFSEPEKLKNVNQLNSRFVKDNAGASKRFYDEFLLTHSNKG